MKQNLFLLCALISTVGVPLTIVLVPLLIIRHIKRRDKRRFARMVAIDAISREQRMNELNHEP